MPDNPWALLADLEEDFGDIANQPRSGSGYSESEVDEEWQKEEDNFRASL